MPNALEFDWFIVKVWVLLAQVACESRLFLFCYLRNGCFFRYVEKNVVSLH